MSYYKWTGKITKVGKKNNPSYYILVPKYKITDEGLKIDGTFEVSATLLETGDDNNGNTTNEHTSI